MESSLQPRQILCVSPTACWLRVSALAAALTAAQALAQADPPNQGANRPDAPPIRSWQFGSTDARTSERPPANEPAVNEPAFNEPAANEPAVAPALRWAKAAVPRIGAIQDYSCTFVQREQTDGVLGPRKVLRLKVRHQPFSVYVHFDAPQDVRGQEVIYVAGQNGGKLLAHGVGLKALAGTVALDPRGAIAMQGSRHPITEVGILNFTHRMIRVLENDARDPQYQVKYFPGTKVHGRSCTCMQFVHPTPGLSIPYYMARVYVDDELNVPVRGETYLWPARQGGEPVLIQEYTYLNLRLNNSFTDRDFDVNNPQYRFR
jgi:hypothetical protein